MSNLIIVRPLPFAALAGSFDNVTRLATPDPKEAAIDAAGGVNTIDLDLGSVQSVDTIFLGYTNDPGTGIMTITSGTAAYTTTARGTIAVAPTDDDIEPRPHFLMNYAAPFDARYIRITTPAVAANYAIGVAVVGLAFKPTWGHEYGAGRQIVDTGSAERLYGGGFGINEGAGASGWQWTLGDLQPAELAKLFVLVKNRRLTRSVLVVEDPDITSGLTERIHWGLFQKLEPYERLDPLNTRWGLSIGDWT